MHLSHFYNQLLTICPPVPALSLHTAGAFFLWQGPTIIIKTDLIHKYLHLKSEDPAARRTLLGCQSRLRMVERIGFLMCLHTHLTDKKPKTNGFPIKVKTSSLCTLETDWSGWRSPVIFLLEVTDGDEARAAAHCKLVLLWRPLDAASSAVDPEDDQSGLPCALLQGPHIGITVCPAGDDAVTVRSPVNTC